jgi:hypothetical protein
MPIVLRDEFPDYFTGYPPICQFIFGLATKLFGGNLVWSIAVIRLFIIASEIGTIYFLRKILSAFNLPLRNVLIYALNPLVIIELTGNLHMEGVMIFFLVSSILFPSINYFFLSFINGKEKNKDTNELSHNEISVSGSQNPSLKFLFSLQLLTLSVLPTKLIPLLFFHL